MVLSPDMVREILVATGACLQNGHFLLSSGLHADQYINKDALYPHAKAVEQLCSAMAENFIDCGIEVVVGPALGGIILAFETAKALNKLTPKIEVFSVYAEKAEDGSMVIKRGFDKLIEGKLVLVTEDILTSGGSAAKTVKAAESCGAKVFGVAALVNRGGVTAEKLGVGELVSLLEVNLPTWKPEECPMCQKNILINRNIGHGGKKK